MTHTTVPDDATAEAILRGVLPPGGHDQRGLAALSDAVEAIRRSADEAVPRTAELRRRIALGDFAGVTPAPPPRGRGVRARLRRRVAAMSLRTRAIAVLATIFTGFTGVAAAGALPEAAQQRVESVVEAVTPITFDAPGEADDFGPDVAEDAQDGGVDGQEVSDDAHELGHRPDDPGREPELPPLPTTVPTTPGEHRPEDPGRPDDTGRPDDPPSADPAAPEQQPADPADPPVTPGERPADPADPPSGAEDRQPTELPQPGGERP